LPMRRLYTRIYLHFLGVLLVVFAATSLVVGFSSRVVFLHGPAERMARHVAWLIGDRLADPPARDRLLHRLAKELEVDVTVLSPTGDVVASAGDPQLTPSREERTQAEGGPVVIRRGGGWRWQVLAPIHDSKSEALRGFLEVSLLRP